MRVAILGTGTLGRALAVLFARAGHAPRFGSRQPGGSLELEAGGATLVAPRLSCAAAVAASDIAVLATPWAGVETTLAAAGDFGGRTLLDATNPEPESGRGLLLGHATSGGELVAGWAQGARVVKTLNHAYAETLLAAGDPAPTLFLCGDDAAARAEAAELLAGCGLDPVDAGGLVVARYLEPLAALLVELVRGRGLAPDATAFRLLRASDSSV